MPAPVRERPFVTLTLGILLGMVIGGLLPDSPAHAVATDRFENFAICTTPMESGVEALCFLDFTNGDLKAAVPNTTNGQFTTFYHRNILADFNLEGVNQPRFLMVSGMMDLRSRAGQAQYAGSVVYIAELASGEVATYAFPWVSGRASRPQLANSQIDFVGKAPFRAVIRRE